MSTFSVKFVQSLIVHIFSDLRKTQANNLGLAIFGLINCQSGILSEIVRKLPGAEKHKHRRKRLGRFVANHRVRPQNLMGLWIAWCFKVFVRGKYIPVAVDWTTLPWNIPCLMAAIPFHGRAIPLLWQIVPYGMLEDSQNRIEERLIARLDNLVPADKRLVLIADRGFGRAGFAEFLLKKKLLFVLRVRADVIITTKERGSFLLRELKLEPEKPKWWTNIAYRKDALVSGVNLAAIVAKGSNDPWFLVTNLKCPSSTIRRYESRFQIEEWFRDIKHQLGIADLRIKDPKKIRRLFFIACVAHGFLSLIGALADRFLSWRDRLISGGKKACSRIWLALKLIQYEIPPPYFWRRVWVRARAES